MLVNDLKAIGSKLYGFRKAAGLTQEEAAEKAKVSIRTYADIERGSVNMRVLTLLRICKAFHITPDDLFTETPKEIRDQYLDVMSALKAKGDKVQKNAYDLLEVYLRSLE